MRFLSNGTGLMLAVLIVAAGHPIARGAEPAINHSSAAATEDYVREPMPSGIQVTHNERDGAVFADSRGHTLYIWPFKPLRVGETGDRPGISNCTKHLYTETGGFQEPYPGGLQLPDLKSRPTCVEVWPPVLAAVDAKPLGKWTIISRDDGTRQWAYGGQPVYTSFLDHKPGDVLGADRTASRAGAGIAPRFPLGPEPNVPPGFEVVSTWTGRVLTADSGRSVYTRDGDGRNKSNCGSDCLRDWKPVLAPALAESHGEFSVFERAPNVKQWAFRNKPLYTYVLDREGGGRRVSFVGSEFPGWHNVYTQKILPLPKEFTPQDSPVGVVVADHRGRTVYIYDCIEDTHDNFACDHPDAPQDYRLAICGAFDPVTCSKTFPYVPATKGAKSESALWSVMTIDPATGRRAAVGQRGALSVWAYRERPVYTFGGDHDPGDISGDRWGEKGGTENGFHAMVMRPDEALLAAGVSAQAKTAGKPILKDRAIGFVITDEYWGVYQTVEGEEECSQGLNDSGPREQFKALYPDDGTKRTLRETALTREAQIWHPTKGQNQFPFKEASGTISYGVNLDGRIGVNDFTSPNGEKGVDNQLFRAIGCNDNFRGPTGFIYHYAREGVREEGTYSRILIELTNVNDLVNDPNVDITISRGRDELLRDATGDQIIPGGTQRVDTRGGTRYIQHLHGKIVDGVLTTEPADIRIPISRGEITFLSGRFRLKLTPEHAEGVLGGYSNIDQWYYLLNRNNATVFQSYGRLASQTLYKKLYQLADAYPDPKTGQNTAISSALVMKFTQVIIQQPSTEVASKARD